MSRLKTAWRILNLPCREMTVLASGSLDRDLDRLERAALRLHLLYCAGCRRYERQIRRLGAALRQLARQVESGTLPDGPGPRLSDDVRRRIERALRDD